MLFIKIKEQIAAKSRREAAKIRLKDIAEATGISVQVLSNISSATHPAVTNTAFVEALCRYFGCELQDLLELSPPEIEDGKVVCHVKRINQGREWSAPEETAD